MDVVDNAEVVREGGKDRLGAFCNGFVSFLGSCIN